MKKASLIIVFLALIVSALFAQRTKPKPVKKATKASSVADWEKETRDEYSDCAYYEKYTVQQRRSLYPFSQAKRVLAVSFKYAGFGPDDPLSNLAALPKEGLFINDGLMDTTTLVEKKELNIRQVDQLSRLIFNTDYKKNDRAHIVSFGKCFESRNAIIFLDQDNRVIDFLEICFSCKQYHSGSEQLDPGILCTQKYELLSNYFKSVGISYGILGRDYH